MAIIVYSSGGSTGSGGTSRPGCDAHQGPTGASASGGSIPTRPARPLNAMQRLGVRLLGLAILGITLGAILLIFVPLGIAIAIIIAAGIALFAGVAFAASLLARLGIISVRGVTPPKPDPRRNVRVRDDAPPGARPDVVTGEVIDPPGSTR